MQHNLEQAFNLMRHGSSIKKAESILEALRRNIDYPILLLSFLNNSKIFDEKLRAAIQLKIWCDSYKNMEEFQRKSYQNIIEDLKSNILLTYINYSEKIQKTLLPAIVSLSVVEFPDHWNALVPGLITCYMQMQTQASLLKVFQLVSEITHKYTYLTRSDPLYSQIIYTCDNFHDFLLGATRNSIENIFQNQNNIISIQVLQQEMILFYNLNSQDLHPLFQDNLPQWMNILNRVMKLPDTNEHFFKCKGACLQSILLYASKYKEDVEDSIKGFSEQIWTLCAQALPDPEYDDIVFNALKYFRSLVMWNDMKGFFAENIGNLVSNLILPNLAFTENYKQLFNEQIQTFIGYYFRNTELNSRRSAALDLLQALVRNYNQPFQQFLRSQLSSFDFSQNYNSIGLCLLLTLVIQSAPKCFRDIDGITQLHIDINIIELCYNTFIKSLLNKLFNKNLQPQPIQNKVNIIEVITTFRFIFYFRLNIPTNDLTTIIQLCCNMVTDNMSLKQVLILTVNALISIRHGNFVLYKDFVQIFNSQNTKQIAKDIFRFIKNRNQEDSMLNEAITKLLYTMIKILKEASIEFYQPEISTLLVNMLQKTDQYNFTAVLFLFQAIGHLTFYLCQYTTNPSLSSSLQNIIQHFFQKVIQKQSDLINFCFQILSIFLQFNNGNISFYDNLYGSVIRVENWREENLSIMSSYIEYVSAYITINNNRIVKDKGIYEQIFGKLIQLDHFQLFYRLIGKIVAICGVEKVYNQGYFETIVKGIEFINQKSLEGRKTTLLFIFNLINEYSSQIVIRALNTTSQGFFQKLLLHNQDIIQSAQTFKLRKSMFNAICSALITQSFSSPQNQAIMFNLLVQNCTSRFKRDKFTTTTAAQTKKQSTYQKLSIFKEIQKNQPSLVIDEEKILVEAFQVCSNKNSTISNFIESKVMERLKRLFDKLQHQ